MGSVNIGTNLEMCRSWAGDVIFFTNNNSVKSTMKKELIPNFILFNYKFLCTKCPKTKDFGLSWNKGTWCLLNDGICNFKDEHKFNEFNLTFFVGSAKTFKFLMQKEKDVIDKILK